MFVNLNAKLPNVELKRYEGESIDDAARRFCHFHRLNFHDEECSAVRVNFHSLQKSFSSPDDAAEAAIHLYIPPYFSAETLRVLPRSSVSSSVALPPHSLVARKEGESASLAAGRHCTKHKLDPEACEKMTQAFRKACGGDAPAKREVPKEAGETTTTSGWLKEGWWERMLNEVERKRQGAPPLHIVVLYTALAGFLIYMYMGDN
jgi:hypothetical protein